MKPYYQDDYVTIYHGDCMEILPSMPNVGLVLTDPPYGVGVEYESFDDTEANAMDLAGKWVRVCIGKSSRVVFTCGVDRQWFYPRPTWVLCWANKAGANMNSWGFSCWQPILVYGKDVYLASGNGARPDLIEHGETSEKNGHPCPKPERFWKKLLCRCSIDDKEMVLDPFMGSGTTLRVAKDLGRKAIGIEIEEKYCEIAAKRMSQEVLDFELREEIKK